MSLAFFDELTGSPAFNLDDLERNANARVQDQITASATKFEAQFFDRLRQIRSQSNLARGYIASEHQLRLRGIALRLGAGNAKVTYPRRRVMALSL